MTPLRNISFGCHGIPDRCFKDNGKHLPFCARCTGASIGHVSAFLNFLILPFPPLLIVFPALAIMLADWLFQNRLHYYHSNLLRFITGTAGGYAVGLLLWQTAKYLWSLIPST